MPNKHTKTTPPTGNEITCKADIYGCEMPEKPGARLAAAFARIDWKRVFIVAVIAVNVLAAIYGLSKVMAAFAIGGATYAVVTGGTTVFYMLFFVAFAVVMIRKYEGYAMLATVMTLLCAFVI